MQIFTLSGLGGWRQAWARSSEFQLFYIRGQEWTVFSISLFLVEPLLETRMTLQPLQAKQHGVLGK